MKTYYLYIKSHTEAPDYEAEVEANSKEEAIQKFLKDPSLREWDEDMIKNDVVSEEELSTDIPQT